MVFSKNNKKYDEKIVIATCNCGCNSELHISHFKDEKEYYISLHSSKFEEEQKGIFDIIKIRLKRALFSLIGKDYLYMDIVMDEYEFNEFITKLVSVKDKYEK